MSTYAKISEAGSLRLEEQYIYGSSRLEMLTQNKRTYELSDYLGNVRSVIVKSS